MLFKYCALPVCFFVAAAFLHAGETVLFDASKDFHRLSSESGAKIAKGDGKASVSYEGGFGENSGIAISGNWDLSGFSSLKFYFDSEPSKEIPLRIVIQNSKVDWSGKNGYLSMGAYANSPSALMKLAFVSPEKNEVAEILSDRKKMRGNPFSMSESNIDLKNVSKIRLYVRNPSPDMKWSLKKIVASTGGGVPERPAWFDIPKEKFFPFIDKYGQFKHKEWKDKIHSDADLQAAIKTENAYLERYGGAADRDKWGGWEKGPKLSASGRFRVEKINGKWWMVDPDGRLFWSHGAVRVTPSSGETPLDGRKFFFEYLPPEGDALGQFYHTHDELLRPYYVKRDIKETYDFSAANIFRKYGDNWLEKYADICHKRFKSWGLNTIANSSDRRIFMMRRTPYIDRFEIKSPELSGSEGYWWAFRDPFDPKFRENVRKNLEERRDEISDPWCIGIFVDNELEWGKPNSHAVWALLSPADCVAKKVFVSILKNKYGEIENLNAVWGSNFLSWDELLNRRAEPPKGSYDDCVAFSEKIIEEYFKVIRSEIKSADPHILYMGCRFAGTPKKNPNVMYICAKYCDAISYNIYRDVLDALALPPGIDKPIIIGEFHFGALDRGKFHTGLVPKLSQEDRAQSYYKYVESALKHPNVIGTHWHQFSDQATTGRFDGENFQVGFTDICDTPYWETVEKVREIGYKMYDVRSGEEK